MRDISWQTTVRGARATRASRERFTELIGPFDPDDELRRAGPIVSVLLSHMSTPRRSPLVTTPLVALARVASFLRIGRVEARAYFIACRIESRVGSVQFRHGTGPLGPEG